MSDLISRQAAIDVVRKCKVVEVTPAYMLIDKAEAMTDLMLLPSAQPEIVRCKDCKFYRCNECFFSTAETEENGFCYWAERRTDEDGGGA